MTAHLAHVLGVRLVVGHEEGELRAGQRRLRGAAAGQELDQEPPARDDVARVPLWRLTLDLCEQTVTEKTDLSDSGS